MIAILDYGSGNLRSAQRAFATTGLEVVVTADRKICVEAEGLVVPGVGAFQTCMEGLLRVSGDEIIRERQAKERSTLGICIGMQILFTEGFEPSREYSGSTAGVGVWAGSISRIKAPVLPHMGWNTVSVAATRERKAGSSATVPLTVAPLADGVAGVFLAPPAKPRASAMPVLVSRAVSEFGGTRVRIFSHCVAATA